MVIKYGSQYLSVLFVNYFTSRYSLCLSHYDFVPYPANPYFSHYPISVGTAKQFCVFTLRIKASIQIQEGKKKQKKILSSPLCLDFFPFENFLLTTEFKQNP